MRGLMILNPGKHRPERMGGGAKPLVAVPWVWADDVRVDGAPRIRLVCSHCDKGIVLPADVRWGPPSTRSGPPSLVSHCASWWLRQHQRCQDAAAHAARVASFARS